MGTVSFSSDSGHLELSWQRHGDSDGDILASVDARVEGFAGHADGTVAEADWERFMREFGSLEHNRKGAATLRSVEDGWFEISLRALDGLGHMAAEGVLSYQRLEWPIQQLRFAFEFDPAQLHAALVRFRSAA